MDTELKLLDAYVSKLKFILQGEQPHNANLGSGGASESIGLSERVSNLDTTIRKKTSSRRLTKEQTEFLHGVFQSCSHPDSTAMKDLAMELNMSVDQIRYWFQNRRTHLKTLKNYEENKKLRSEIEKLKMENEKLRKRAINSTGCHSDCPLVHRGLGQNFCSNHLDSTLLRVETKRKPTMMGNLNPRVMSSSVPRSNGMTAQGSNLGSNAVQMPRSVMPSSALQPTSALHDASLSGNANDIGHTERNMLLGYANRAMDEFTFLVQKNEPLWVSSMDIMGLDTLNYQAYAALSRTIGQTPQDFAVNATRDIATVKGGCLSIVASLSTAHRWSELFPGIVASAKTTKIISTGVPPSCDGLIQLIHAELQVMSPAVPVCDVAFLRYSKKHEKGLWSVVDVSVDAILPGENRAAQPVVQTSRTAARHMGIRLLPSGWFIQEIDNGYSKVTSVMHTAYDDSVVPMLYRPLLRSGKALGACRWVASLQRQSQFLSSLRNSILGPDNTVLLQLRHRKNVLHLVKQMTRNFTAICVSMTWPQVGGAATHFAFRRVGSEPGEPTGMVLSATAVVRLPGVKPRRVYDYLRDEQCLSEWRHLFSKDLHQGNTLLPHGAPMNGQDVQKFFRITNGLHEGHAISLISHRETEDNISSTLLMQEARTDPSESLIVYAATDVNTVHSMMNGSVNPASIFLVPSGCAIVPDCLGTFPLHQAAFADQASSSSAAITGRSSGSIVTVTYQMFVSSLTNAGSIMQSVESGRDRLKNATNMFAAMLHSNILA